MFIRCAACFEPVNPKTPAMRAFQRIYILETANI
jgi:hypothetical protein